MARRDIPTLSELWTRHEALYVDIFSLALTLLSQRKCSLDDEDKISEQLCPLLKSVCFSESKNRKYDIPTPIPETPTLPTNDGELKGGLKKRKRPDFTCKHCNPFATCAEEYEIALHIECKLLGNPTSKTWILNKNYVTNGILRFDNEIHEYGKQAPSGIMIGYIVSMKPEQIVDEVNIWQQEQCPHNQALSFQFNTPPVFEEKQNLNRKNVEPKSFHLIHLWVDLRNRTLK